MRQSQVGASQSQVGAKSKTIQSQVKAKSTRLGPDLDQGWLNAEASSGSLYMDNRSKMHISLSCRSPKKQNLRSCCLYSSFSALSMDVAMMRPVSSHT